MAILLLARKTLLAKKNAPAYYAIRGGKIAGYGGMAWLEMALKIEDAVNTAAVAVAVVRGLLLVAVVFL